MFCVFQPSRLNVYKNDTESWDYTNPALGKTDRLGARHGDPVRTTFFDVVPLMATSQASSWVSMTNQGAE